MMFATIAKIIGWMNESRKRYEVLINAYTTQETKLMDKLSSTAQTLFNDTPQSGGSFTTDNYVTNATQVTTSTDTTTPMARLKEISDNLENLYKSWSNEFRKFIMF